MSGVRTVYLHGSNKGLGMKFQYNNWFQHETPEVGWSIHQLKCSQSKIQDEDTSLTNINSELAELLACGNKMFSDILSVLMF